MTREHEGHVAVITGAARGIGRTLARGLAETGAHVVIADLDAGVAADVAAQFRSDGLSASSAELDVSDPDSVRRCAADVTDRAGPVHIVVNNAGLYRRMQFDSVLDVELSYWRKVMSVNLDGPLLVTQAFAPGMISAGWGRVVNISSTGAFTGGNAPYCTSKLALLALTVELARALGPHGTTVNAIAPGSIYNESTSETVSPDMMQSLVAMNAIPRAGSETDLVGALLYLCSEGAAYTTGQTLIVDGGNRRVNRV
jgi:3-oxoacyl-[acyl-carrier protein] reductase